MLFSFENLHRQYLACRRNKRNTLNALRFEVRQEENLLDLQAALTGRSYAPSRSVCFFVKRPKLREIFAADFRDRVVHHVLVDYLERIWEPIFIHDSYACRRGKGVHAGVNRLRQFIRQATRNGTRPAWYLQLDIHNYFMSIDKDVLFALLAPKIDDDNALWLTRVLVYHDCTGDYVIKGDPAMLDKMPPHKTLFKTDSNKGLPIGNLNSQFFANVYLNGLDQFVKHGLKCRHYLRYCDDFVLLSDNREQDAMGRWPVDATLTPSQRVRPAGQRDRRDGAFRTGGASIMGCKPLSIPQTGETIRPHNKFRLVATGNSAGGGDRSGLYQGVLRQNLGPAGPVSPDGGRLPRTRRGDAKLAGAVPTMPPAVADKMVKVANEIRKVFVGGQDGAGELSLTLSTRGLLRWATLAAAFKGAPNA